LPRPANRVPAGRLGLDSSMHNLERGRIELICGCMFAGKTARLIELLREAQARD